MGKIGLENCRFFAKHGFYDIEKQNGNTFEVNIEVNYDFSDASREDILDKSLNYEELYKEVEYVMNGASVNILEHLCHKIIDRIKSRFSEITFLKIRIAKLNPPIKGDIEKVWVEMESKYS